MRSKGIKKVTVDELAQMTQNGFTHMENSFKTGLAEHTRVILEEFRRLNADIKHINTTLGPTVVIVAEQEKRIQNLESRLVRVERKVGLASTA